MEICDLKSAYSARQPVKNGEARRKSGPIGATRRKDRNLGAKTRRIIKGTGVNREIFALADHAAKDETAAGYAEIAGRRRAASRGRDGLAGRAGNGQGRGGKVHEGDEARTGRLAAVGAIAMTGHVRLAARFIAECAAEAAAGVDLGHGKKSAVGFQAACRAGHDPSNRFRQAQMRLGRGAVHVGIAYG